MRPLHLKEGELGSAMLAVEGWLRQIKAKRKRIERFNDQEIPYQRFRNQPLTPKAFYNVAQGQRSPACRTMRHPGLCGREVTSTLKALHNRRRIVERLQRSNGCWSSQARVRRYATILGYDVESLQWGSFGQELLVSGGSEDPPRRWEALNHTIEINRILGHKNRIAMTNRRDHSPNEESNEVIYSFFEHFLMIADM
jgi:hypothetical protein